MSRPLLYLRIAISVACGIACVLLALWWVRSYTWIDMTHRKSPINICSVEGNLLIGKHITHVSSKRRTTASVPDVPPRFGFYADSLKDWRFIFADEGITIPYWVCTLVMGLIAVLVWLPWRFSLRTLLIATTLVAVVLGAIAYQHASASSGRIPKGFKHKSALHVFYPARVTSIGFNPYRVVLLLMIVIPG